MGIYIIVIPETKTLKRAHFFDPKSLLITLKMMRRPALHCIQYVLDVLHVVPTIHRTLPANFGGMLCSLYFKLVILLYTIRSAF